MTGVTSLPPSLPTRIGGDNAPHSAEATPDARPPHSADAPTPAPLIALPVADALLAAHAAGDSARVVACVDSSALEAWFGVPPDQLRAVLDALPPSATTASPTVRAFRLLLNGPHPEPVKDVVSVTSEDPRRTFGQIAAMMFDARLHGESDRASGIAHFLEENSAPNALFDETAGLNAFVNVQNGITSMLSGDFADALTRFDAAAVTAPPLSLTVLLRDSYVKSALVHALYGDRLEAQHDLDLADALPATASWAEHLVWAHAELARAVLSPDDALDEAIERVDRLPALLMAELWPFRVAAVMALATRAGRLHEGLAKIEAIERSAPAHVPGEGMPGSIVAVVSAVAALSAGRFADARALIAAADQRLVLVQLIRDALRIAGDDLDPAIQNLVGLRAQTAGLRQLDIVRTSRLAWALLRRGDNERAAALLSDLIAMPGGIQRAEAVDIPLDVRDFGARTFAEWPASIGGGVPSTTSEIDTARPRLTAREREILVLLASDKSRTEIAQELFVSLNTLKSQQRALYRKLNVSTRVDAVLQGDQFRLL